MTASIYTLLGIGILFSAWRFWRRLSYFLHLFQLEGYKLNEFTDWLRQNRRGVFVRRSHQAALVAIGIGTALILGRQQTVAVLVLVLAWPVIFASSKRYRNENAKKPIRYTSRMKRLIAGAIVIAVVPLVAFVVAGLGNGLLIVPHILAGLLVADLGCPQWVLIAARLLESRENKIQEGFKTQAQTKLAARPDLHVIAITGSYGKTSVKNAIAKILAHRFNVLASPGSYNTPMGLCLVINNMLRFEHQVLILEMGARYVGDIQELCELVTPATAIVTNVGVAHTETMGNQESIALEKGTLVENVEPGGLAILNADDPYVNAMSSRTMVANVLRVGIDNLEADLVASEISYSNEGASFLITDNTTDTSHAFKTQLLGKHNIMNILLAVAVGKSMDLRLRQMAHAVAQLEPVAHRLKLRDEGPILVLDDAFNSNPVGARNAVEILGQFSSGRRIVITPGMVELGEIQNRENADFGRVMAANADLVLLVGPEQTAPILTGLLEEGFSPDNVHTFFSLAEAQEFLKGFAQPGDIVLYENDLPDQYDEAT